MTFPPKTTKPSLATRACHSDLREPKLSVQDQSKLPRADGRSNNPVREVGR